MQEIKKTRIVIASVLKPVDEPRMFERIGKSLAENGYEISIIGSQPSSHHEMTDIQFIPHQKFKRFSVSRILVRFDILKQILYIKPEVLIIATHELIGVAMLFKIITRKKIIYDVQENYYNNILYTNAFPKGTKWLIAFMVRLKEIITSTFISTFLLAEKCYDSELKFTKGKSVVIENKCRMPKDFVRRPSKENIEIIFTGTLAESTGVFQAIDLVKKLHLLNSKIKLRLIGYCSIPRTLMRIKREISEQDFISLIGGDDFVSHQTIFEAISSANFGIIHYPDSLHTKNRIPSKLFEYLSCKLPILIQDNALWAQVADQYQACLKVNFETPDVNSLLQAISTNSFYKTNPQDAEWITEEVKLLKAISSVSI